MSILQVGVIGAGVISATAHRDVFNAQRDKIRVVSICDAIPERARSMSESLSTPAEQIHSDHHALLVDPSVDTVLVAVPPYLAGGIAIDALRAGKNVVMEKPMGDTAEDARKVLEAAREASGKFIVAENFFFPPAFARLREIAESNEWPFGHPHLVELRQFWKMSPKTIPQFYHSPWRHDERLTHGYLIEGGCHTVNLLRELFGMPTQILSRMFSVDPQLGRHDTLLAHCLLGGTTPCQLTMTYSMESPDGRTALYFHSKDGTVIANDWEKLVFLSAEGDRTEIPCPMTCRDTHEAVWLHFHDMVFAGARPAFTTEQAYSDVLFMQQLIDEARVDVPSGQAFVSSPRIRSTQ
jgi:predicted dehydrogenase